MCSIIFAITAIAVIKANVVAEAVTEIDKKIKTQTFFIKSLTIDAEGLLARANSEEMKIENIKQEFQGYGISNILPSSVNAISMKLCERNNVRR